MAAGKIVEFAESGSALFKATSTPTASSKARTVVVATVFYCRLLFPTWAVALWGEFQPDSGLLSGQAAGAASSATFDLKPCLLTICGLVNLRRISLATAGSWPQRACSCFGQKVQRGFSNARDEVRRVRLSSTKLSEMTH